MDRGKYRPMNVRLYEHVGEYQILSFDMQRDDLQIR